MVEFGYNWQIEYHGVIIEWVDWLKQYRLLEYNKPWFDVIAYCGDMTLEEVKKDIDERYRKNED